MVKSAKSKAGREKLAILVVHGVGEQGCFEHLEAIAANLKQALEHQKRNPCVELHVGDSETRLSQEHSLRESPVTVRWRTADGREIEVLFREVHWADLDMPKTWQNSIKLLGWSLSAPGVRLFSQSTAGTPAERGMCAPELMGLLKRLWVRAQLFVVSLAFLILLVTIGVVDQILKRFSGSLPRFITRILTLVHNYLGDVKLYQDWLERKDERVEVIGQKSRVAIRHRMIRSLVQTAAEVERGEIHGFYVFAHSLGTVVAFNGLMETGVALPNCLTEEEWVQLPAGLKSTSEQALPPSLSAGRPSWLDGGAAGQGGQVRPRDQIDRRRLLAGMRGFLTMGSPLDKFAALWPEIVLINKEDPGCQVPWINVADVQDIVGGKIDLIKPCPDSDSVSGLKLIHNFRWSDQLLLGTAHTNYWRAKNKPTRLIDRVVSWLEGEPFQEPEPARPRWLSWFIYAVSVVLIFGALLLVLAWLMSVATATNTSLAGPNAPGIGNILYSSITATPESGVILANALSLLAKGSGVIIVFSTVRWFWERIKFG